MESKVGVISTNQKKTKYISKKGNAYIQCNRPACDVFLLLLSYFICSHIYGGAASWPEKGQSKGGAQ